MKTIVLILWCMLLAGCGDVVTSKYASIADARADELFERGWLPDILPESAHDIRTTNNLDLNFSVGEFEFGAEDAQVLFSRLHPGAPQVSKFSDWPATIQDYADDGYLAWTWQQYDATWVFFCNRGLGRCEYMMWMEIRDVTPEDQANSDTPGTSHKETLASATPIPVAASTSLG